MKEFDIDYYAKAIFFQNELYTLKDLGEKIKFNISNGNYKIGDLYGALEKLQTALESTKEIQLIIPNNLYNKCLAEANSKKISVEQFLIRFLENAFEAKELKGELKLDVVKSISKESQENSLYKNNLEKTNVEIPIIPTIKIENKAENIESIKPKTQFSSAEQLIQEEDTNIERPTGKFKKTELLSSENLEEEKKADEVLESEDVVIEEVVVHSKPKQSTVIIEDSLKIEENPVQSKKSDTEILEEIVIPKQKKEPLNIEDILLKKDEETQKNSSEKSKQNEVESEDVAEDWFK
ncbi:hypothetical protein JXR93_05815 [bacterium]|nr:hypothetical protein [bacterium]